MQDFELKWAIHEELKHLCFSYELERIVSELVRVPELYPHHRLLLWDFHGEVEAAVEVPVLACDHDHAHVIQLVHGVAAQKNCTFVRR